MMQKLKQSEIQQILKNYSVLAGEFMEVSQFSFQSQIIKGYMISLSVDAYGRIIASHTQDNGKRTYVDVWERINDKLSFKFRNLNNQPLSDAEYIKDLERQISDLKTAGRKLQERLNDIENNSRKLIYGTKTDERPKNERGAGRKPSQERLNTIAKVKALLDAGSSEQAIMEELNISRATFYRYKQNLNY